MDKLKKLEENELEVNQIVLKLSLRMLWMVILLIGGGIAMKSKIIDLSLVIFLFILCCIVPFIFSKMHYKYNMLKYVSILCFSLIISVIYSIIGKPGLLLLFFIPVGIACTYFNEKVVKWSFICMFLGVNISWFYENLHRYTDISKLLMNTAVNLVFSTIVVLIVSRFFLTLTNRTRNNLFSVIEKEEQTHILTQELSKASQKLLHTSETLKNQALNLNASTDQISSDLLSFSEGVNKQLESIEEVFRYISIANQGIDSINEDSVKVTTDIENSSDSAEQSIQFMQASLQKVCEVNESITAAKITINMLQQNLNSINGFTDMITNISEQTNMLALNAAIEAARAGEYGKGFSVVSDEIRKLALQSAQAVNEITKVVEGIQQNILVVMSSMDDTFNRVKESIQASEAVKNNIGTVLSSNMNISSSAKAIFERINTHLNDNIKDILAKVEKMKYVSNSFAEQAQDMSAASEEQTALVSEFSALGDNVTDTSKLLYDLVRKLNN